MTTSSKIAQFKKVLELDPQDETLWFGLGKAYMDEERWQAAIEALETCIRIKPTYSAAYYALAQAYYRNQDLSQCREICQRGREIAMTNGDLLVVKNLEQLASVAEQTSPDHP
ncbi:MAG: tetratricopeptide repeat protein [Nitrospirae bacterium]|nr:MAG: tetratricopeptide repeat protein [Nitrospirota bacterium]